MKFNKKIDKIDVDNDRLHVFYKTGTKNEILFSELKDIYITVNKISPIYELVIIMAAIIAAIIALFYFQANFILIVSSLLIVMIVVKMNNYKRYDMKINLKNGLSIKKPVPLKLKNETVEFVNDVRKKVYTNKIEMSNKITYRT